MSTAADLFPIGVLAEATGVNTITLRAWERRYGLLKPQRTAKGHRLYSVADVEMVERILTYIRQGVSVGKVKNLLKLAQPQKQDALEQAHNNWSVYVEEMLTATAAFNLNKLDSIYNEVISLYPIEIISTRLLLPLLKTYQARMLANYKGAIAEEHFLASFIRNRLAAHFQQLATMTKGKVLVFATLESERHDFLLLLFGIHCMNAGFKVVSLGSNTPLGQSLYAMEKLNATALVCFGHFSKEDQKYLQTTHELIFNFAHNGTAVKNALLLEEDFAIALQTLRQHIKMNGGKNG